jgi:hypothetical protein
VNSPSCDKLEYYILIVLSYDRGYDFFFINVPASSLSQKNISIISFNHEPKNGVQGNFSYNKVHIT